jgi:hypothetical protein
LRIGNIKREYDKGFDAGVTCMVNRILEAPTIIEGREKQMNARQKAKKYKKKINTLESDNDLMRRIIADSPAMQETL